KRLASELKVVALLVNREASVAEDENALLHIGYEVVQAGVVTRWLERDIGHARKGHAAPTVGMTAGVRRVLSDQAGQIARSLPIYEDSVLDQVPALSRHAIVVVANRSQAPWLSAVREEIHNVRAILELAGFVRRQEACARKVSFPAQRTVQLRGVTDAF